MCPGKHASAGKRRSGKTAKGSLLVAARVGASGWGSHSQKEQLFSSAPQNLIRHPSGKRDLVGVAHTLRLVIYHS